MVAILFAIISQYQNIILLISKFKLEALFQLLLK